MSVRAVQNLRRENWLGLSFDEKVQALRDLETGLAASEKRTACRVEADLESGMGLYSNGTIHLNPNLLADGKDPYEAVETYFHEARHAYQDYAVQHPGYHDNEAEVADWQNEVDGYIPPPGKYDPNYQENFLHYEFQPNEVDANAAARAEMDKLYGQEFQDDQAYGQYKEDIEQYYADEQALASEMIGENYEEVIRQEVATRHAQAQAASQDKVLNASTGQGAALPAGEEELAEEQPAGVQETAGELPEQEQETGESTGIDQPTPEQASQPEAAVDPPSASAGSGEEEHYDYGYGY